MFGSRRTIDPESETLSAAWFPPEIFSVCFLGVAGFLMGLLEMAARTGRRKRLWGSLAALCTAAMLLLAGAASYYGQAAAIWLPPLLLAAVASLLLVCRLPCAGGLRQTSQCLARKRLVQGVVLLFAGPCAGLAWASYIEHNSVPLQETVQDDVDPFDRSNLHEISPSPAITDAGRPVRVFVLPQDHDDAALSEYDKGFMEKSIFRQRILRLAGPDARTNCFGWVFTGGRFWIRKSEEVDAILQDNDYHEVPAPQAGDLAVYRGPDGRVSHVGVVRVADEEGLVLIESKWSWLGLFVHRPEDQCYSTDCTYYRSPRRSHLLRGLESDSETTASSASSIH
jgi:hypothetical protein